MSKKSSYSSSKHPRIQPPLEPLIGPEDGVALLLHTFVYVTLALKLGLISGSLAFIILLYVKDWIIYKTMRLEGLKCMDYIFLHDSEKSRGNILGKSYFYLILRYLRL